MTDKMEHDEIPQTDSGYTTSRGASSSPCLDSPSEQVSPEADVEEPVTSTPLRGTVSQPLRDPFPNETNIDMNKKKLETEKDNMKKMLSVSKELQKQSRENETLRNENTSLQEANASLLNETRRTHEGDLRDYLNEQDHQDYRESPQEHQHRKPPIVPKLQLEDSFPVESSKIADLKKEILSFVSKEEDRTLVEQKLEHVLSPMIYMANAEILVHIDKMDADAQTEEDDQVTVINTQLQIEVDQLRSQLEDIELKSRKEVQELEHRQFNFEALKAEFEEDREKLRLDLEKKLKASADRCHDLEKRSQETEKRLSTKRHEYNALNADYRKLMEESTSRDTELEDVRKKLAETLKKKVSVERKMRELEDNLESMKNFAQVEKREKERVLMDAENSRKEQEKKMEERKAEAEEAVEKTERALEELAKVEKENDYLRKAQGALLDSEMNLKSNASEMNSKIRILEEELESVKKALEEATRHREDLEYQILDFELTEQANIDEKQRANELHEDLKKSKLELEYLREQLREQTESIETQALRAELVEAQKKMEQLERDLQRAAEDEDESKKSINEFIRNEQKHLLTIEMKEEALAKFENELKAKSAKLAELTEKVEQDEKTIKQLQDDLENTEFQFADFQKHANLQYVDQVGRRDEEIIQLRQRLVELETYPGQTISVSKKNVEIQTDEVEKEPEMRQEESHISVDHEKHDRIERNMQKMIARLEAHGDGHRICHLPPDLQADPTPEYHCAETVHQVADLIKAIYSDDPVAEADLFRDDVLKRMISIDAVREKELSGARNEITRVRERVREQEGMIAELEGVAKQQADLALQRFHLANEFRHQYDLEVEENKRQNEQLQEYISELEKAEIEQRELRIRLEDAQHDVELEKRRQLDRKDEFDAQQDELVRTCKANTWLVNDREALYVNLKNSEARRETLEKARQNDKQTMSMFKNSFNDVCGIAKYWRDRNSARHKLLCRMLHQVEQVLGSGDPNMSMGCIQKLRTAMDQTRQRIAEAEEQESRPEYRVPPPLKESTD